MLGSQRQKIDQIDREIVRLFEERTKTVEEVARVKLENDQPILDEGREKAVIEKVQSYLKDSSLEEELADLYTQIMRISRDHQKAWMDQQK